MLADTGEGDVALRSRLRRRTFRRRAIVMDTEQELEVAFKQLKRGIFIKERP